MPFRHSPQYIQYFYHLLVHTFSGCCYSSSCRRCSWWWWWFSLSFSLSLNSCLSRVTLYLSISVVHCVFCYNVRLLLKMYRRFTSMHFFTYCWKKNIYIYLFRAFCLAIRFNSIAYTCMWYKQAYTGCIECIYRELVSVCGNLSSAR